MSRTIRKATGREGRIDYAKPGVRSYYSRERKWARKQTNRTNRNRAATLLRNRRADHDDLVIPDPPSTGGWISH